MRINTIEIENFKFFREMVKLDLGGKNLLIFGENGSGKSSLYWALYTFFQSSMKTDDDVKKYFTKDKPENLLNKYCESDESSIISIELKDKHERPTKYTISKNLINTNKTDDTMIKEANLASDFINYRVLSRLYDFRNSQYIDLFTLFKRDIFDYITMSESNKNVAEEWQRLSLGITDKPSMTNPVYVQFKKDIETFNNYLETYLTGIVSVANKILKDDFNEKIELSIQKFEPAAYDKKIPNTSKARDGKTHEPEIIMTAKLLDSELDDDTSSTILKPHTYLNEAKLTAIALSIRLAVLKEKLSETKLKVILLDDLLISLDMSHRLSVIDIILNHMEEMQLIVMTHDKAFYEIMNRYIENRAINDKWISYEFKIGNNCPKIEKSKNNIELAKDYFGKYDYEACASYLRKELESVLKKYLDPSLISQDYQNLSSLLNKVLNEIISNHSSISKSKIDKLILEENISPDILNYLNKDFTNDDTLNSDDKRKLHQLRSALHKFATNSFTTQILPSDSEDVKLFKSIKLMVNRVLNPASHSSIAPLFRKEVEDALNLVNRLKEFLKNKSSQNAPRKNQIVDQGSFAGSTTQSNSVNYFVFNTETEIIQPIRMATTAAELVDVFTNKISTNINDINKTTLQKIFDELIFKRAIKNDDIDHWLVRCYRDKENWSNEEKIIWGNFIISLFTNNSINDFAILSTFEATKCISVNEHYDNYGNLEHRSISLANDLLSVPEISSPPWSSTDLSSADVPF